MRRKIYGLYIVILNRFLLGVTVLILIFTGQRCLAVRFFLSDFFGVRLTVFRHRVRSYRLVLGPRAVFLLLCCCAADLDCGSSAAGLCLLFPDCSPAFARLLHDVVSKSTATRLELSLILTERTPGKVSSSRLIALLLCLSSKAPKVKYTLAFDITITSALVCVPASRFIRQLKKL